jgi:hypothetical protein
MSRTRRPVSELIEQLAIQREFLSHSRDLVDSGSHNEALRLAVVLRTLLHNTRNQRALLSQLGVDLEVAMFWDTTLPGGPPEKGRARVGLLFITMSDVHPKPRFAAPLGGNPFLEPKLTLFPEWWRGTISYLGEAVFSRRDYVLAAANREGGAHVDPHLDPVYEAFHASGIKGGEIGGGDERLQTEANGPALVLRQITYEVERTLDDLPETRPSPHPRSCRRGGPAQR